jgi:predicted kinase
MMETGTLIIFAGLPGSGKSTLAAKLASRLAATYLRIDTIEQGLRDVCGLSKVEGEGYRLAYRMAGENLRLGNTVIADSVNPWELTRKEWNDVAKQAGARFINIEVVCSDPEEHRKRVESRAASVPGLKMPTWQDVLERDYHPWKGKRCSVDTAGKGEEDCLTELLILLQGKSISGFEE